MTRLAIDIVHPADVNFFKNAIRILTQRNQFEVEITVQPRGNLVSILQKELKNPPYKAIWHYESSFLGKSLSLFGRSLLLFRYLRERDLDVLSGLGGTWIAPVGFALGKPSVVFEDDVEFTLGYLPYIPFATRTLVPENINLRGRNVKTFKGFKELAYLHPRYFTPNPSVLQEYGLEQDNYVFLREVSNTSLNYRGAPSRLLRSSISALRRRDLTIVVSSETKLLDVWKHDQVILLQEPLEDLYSILHFALFTISAGDTVARESCLLGTPAIYTGGRRMAINSELEREACLFSPSSEEEVLERVKELVETDRKRETRRSTRQLIEHRWQDTTEVIVDSILQEVERNT